MMDIDREIAEREQWLNTAIAAKNAEIEKIEKEHKEWLDRYLERTRKNKAARFSEAISVAVAKKNNKIKK